MNTEFSESEERWNRDKRGGWDDVEGLNSSLKSGFFWCAIIPPKWMEENWCTSTKLLLSYLMSFLDPTFMHSALQIIPNRQLWKPKESSEHWVLQGRVFGMWVFKSPALGTNHDQNVVPERCAMVDIHWWRLISDELGLFKRLSYNDSGKSG